MDFSENRVHFPATVQLLESLPCGHYHHALFSALAPHTHITPHHGPTNRKLRCQLPLIVPVGEGTAATLRVADETKALEEGKLIIFDDSFEHEATNTSAFPRIVLIFDIWHPDLTKEEVKFFEYINKYEMRALQHMQIQQRQTTAASGEEDTFLDVIERGRRAKEMVSPNDIWSEK